MVPLYFLIVYRVNLPDRITIFRIFLLPLRVVFLITPSKIASFLAALILGLASFTDWLDGHIARSTNQVTTFGKSNGLPRSTLKPSIRSCKKKELNTTVLNR